MKTNDRASPTRLLVAAIFAGFLVPLTGCGPKVSGTYVGVPGQSVFDQVELQPNGKVIVTLIGIAHEATYEVKGSTVVVNNQGQLNELKIDSHGCLVDAIGGTYCKDGHTPGTATAAGGSPAAPASGALSGSYVAKAPNGMSMTIEFVSGNAFRLTMGVPGGTNNAVPGAYVVQGDHVRLTATGDSEVLDLTRKGNTLEGTIDRDRLTFTKR